ncbi:polysaccharide biosynthesis/export family protein [Microcoleus sp. FACHB-672]|uniref:polysaccharide biosynthesis/export family protein n=1 Tax=Microcoleus sp. FACHB-672 TaxID=2692825 RepID=UPI0016855089|nr:polysaccharide biosynthesis/export family protein [Microcoleus sp. FACHB-672]MBD2043023.1 SLBB domain-containing protein [Microcoleus sp. FACHB-672]
MVYVNFFKQITLPVVSLTLVAVAFMASPFPSIAQVSEDADAAGFSSGTAYKLGGGDRILIEIVEVPELSGEYEILSDGSVVLRLAGSVDVRGMTLEQAAAAITAKYESVLNEPVISVTLSAIRPLNVGVTGEVTRPGIYSLNLIPGVGVRPGVQYPTVTQAIEKAGGITQAANIREVQVRRPQRSGPDRIININLWEMLQGGDYSRDMILQDGDAIFIPSSTSTNLAEARQIATASFSQQSEQPRTVTVVGEVYTPGSYVVIGGNTTLDLRNQGLPTVTRAIQLAGGIKPLADIRQVQLRRPTKAGGEQVINVNLWQLLQTGDTTQDTIVQDGDTIIIPTVTEVNPAEAADLATANFSPTAIRVYVVGEVRVGGAGSVLQVPANTTLNQALLSGGFGYDNPRARRDSVKLIRLNPDGTVAEREVSVDLTQGINDQTNPLLRNNDIIVIERNRMTAFSDRLGSAIDPIVKVYPLFNFLGVLRSLFRF